MKERPILFNAEMVAAVLAGRKTQTRRIIRGQPPADWEPYYNSETQSWECPDERTMPRKCPFGVPGDRLWVREAWRVVGWWDGGSLLIVEYRYKTVRQETCSDTLGYDEVWADRMMIQSTEDCEKAGWSHGDDGYYSPNVAGELPTRWRPSIHMPRWCSRIDLEVVRVWPERLQAISDNDARAEGVKRYGGMYVDTSRHILPFSQLWESIYAKPRPVYRRVDGKRVIDQYESYPWEDVQEWREWRGRAWQVIGNPWVWACEFKEVTG